jgi:hypothetical protein
MSPTVARYTKRVFRPAPEGLHAAVCVDVIDHGMKPSPWGEMPVVELRWQIEELNPDNNKRYLVMQRYRLSLHEKARLRHHVEGWRGKKLTQAEAERGVILENLIGVGCQLQIVHNTVRDGETYANVQAIVPLSKGTARLTPLDYVRMPDRDDAAPAAEAGEDTADTTEDAEEEFPF